MPFLKVSTFTRNPWAQFAARSSIRRRIACRLACMAPLVFAATLAQAQFGAQPVGVASGPQQIQVTATAAGTVSRVEVLTLGSANGDFTAGAGPSNCAAANLPVGGTCTQWVAFTPVAPGLRLGAVVLVGTVNGAKTVLGTTYLSGTGTAETSPAETSAEGSGAPVAGSMIPVASQPGSFAAGVDDDEPATQAVLDEPGGAALDGAGNLYIADTGYNRIRMVCGAAATPTIQGTACAGAGIISTIAGDGSAAYTGDGGPAASATLNSPGFVALDGAGNLYIADTANNAIRVIDAVTGLISTVAGNANGTICGSASDEAGDGCPATEATLNQPQGVALDAAGDLFIADTGNDATRFVSRATGAISTITAASTTTAVTSSLDPSGFGQSVTFTVTVSAGAGTGSLTGTVSITDTLGGATATLASGLALNASGAATFSISTLAVGQHSITASYNNANDPAHAASTSSPALVETVLEGTSVSLTSSADPSAIGQSITFTAKVTSSGGGVTPTGTVTFSDGAAVLSAPTLNGSGVATYTTSSLANGSHQIVAVYNGSPSTEVEGSTSPVVYQDVLASSSIAVSSSLNPSTYGLAVTFTATVTSAATSPATGTVSFLDNGVSIRSGKLSGNPGTATFILSTLAAGTHAITVAYAGDGSNQSSNSSASPLDQAVQQGETVTSVSATPVTGIAGTPETIAATVELARGSGPLTGTVNFTSGSTLLGSAALNASGVAVITPTLATGAYEIVATYEGNSNAIGSASAALACSGTSLLTCSGAAPLLLMVTLATTQTAFTVSPTTAVASSSIAFTATVTGNGVTPTGSVNFLANGVVIGTSPLNAGTATFTDSALPAGSYAMTAEYLGNANDATSNSASVSATVSDIPTATVLAAATTTGNNPQVVLTAKVTGASTGPEPAGTVTFLSGTASLGTATLDPSGVATLMPALIKGTNYSIAAVYGGDAFHGSSTSQTLTVAGVAYGFTVTVNPSTTTISALQSSTVTVTLTSIANFTDTVGLSCASLPAAVSCQFASSSLNLPAGGTASTQLTIGANLAQSGATTAANRRAGKGRVALAGLFLPLSLGFGWLFWRLRRRNARLFALALLLFAAAWVVAGCAKLIPVTAAPGNYVIEVTASGATTNVIKSQNVNLDITK